MNCPLASPPGRHPLASAFSRWQLGGPVGQVLIREFGFLRLFMWQHFPLRRSLLPLLTGAALCLVACNKPPPPAAPPAAVTADEKEMTIEEMTGAVQAWVTSRGEAPKNFQEMIKAGFIRKMPAPPPGKEFAIDAKNLQVVLRDQLIGN